MKKILIFVSIFLIIFTCNAEQISKGGFFSGSKLKTDYISCFLVDENNLWTGTDFGIYRFIEGKIASAFYSEYKIVISDKIIKRDGNCFLSDNNINDIVKIGNKIYFATDYGISVYDYIDNTWSLLDTKNSMLKSNYIQSLDKIGNELWIGSINGGLYKWNIDHGNLEVINKKNKQGDIFKNIDANEIFVVETDVKDNMVFVGTLNNGFYYLKNSTWTNITTKFPVNSRMPSNRVSCLEYYDDILWIGTNRGLVKYDIKNNDFKLYNKQTGFSSSAILCVKKIGSKLYVGTAQGLYVILLEKEELRKVVLSQDYRILDITEYFSKLWIATQNNGIIVQELL